MRKNDYKKKVNQTINEIDVFDKVKDYAYSKTYETIDSNKSKEERYRKFPALLLRLTVPVLLLFLVLGIAITQNYESKKLEGIDLGGVFSKPNDSTNLLTKDKENEIIIVVLQAYEGMSSSDTSDEGSMKISSDQIGNILVSASNKEEIIADEEKVQIGEHEYPIELIEDIEFIYGNCLEQLEENNSN